MDILATLKTLVDWVLVMPKLVKLNSYQRSESFTFVDVNSDVRFQFENEDADRDFFDFSLDVSSVLPHGWPPYVQFRATTGHDYLDSYLGTIGIRKEF